MQETELRPQGSLEPPAMALEKTTWARLDESLRSELEALLKSPSDRYYSQYHDAMAWWLLLMLASVGGLIAFFVEWSSDLAETLSAIASDPSVLPAVLMQPHWLGLVACLVVAPWTALTWIRSHNRRGLALTRTAIVVVRGATLKLLPLSEIATASSRSIGARGKRFSVLTLELRSGQKLELNTSGAWAGVVTDAALRLRSGMSSAS